MSEMQTYGELVQERNKVAYCPFCNEGVHNYIDHNDTACVLSSRAPYAQDHILVCPKDHVLSMSDLSTKQSQDIRTLIHKRDAILSAQHNNLVIFLREGAPGGVTGKTVGHLHRHIIPNFAIRYQATQQASDAREFMSDEQYQDSIQHLQSYLP